MITIILSVLAFASATTHIYVERKGLRRYAYVFKPLTMVLLLLIGIFAAKESISVYGLAIIAGIVFSLAGDVALMLPKKQIIIGMGAFLVAHVAYIISFSSSTFAITNVWLLVPFLLYVIMMGWTVLPRAGKLKIPVGIYEVAIMIMAWRALERMLQTGNTSAVLALAGALLFVISDSLWACNFIVKRCKKAQVLILVTYYLAQWLIVLSTSPLS
ncbi:MAG: lysoplasmalogenase [Candidatus Methanospirareceae archaeon]